MLAHCSRQNTTITCSLCGHKVRQQSESEGAQALSELSEVSAAWHLFLGVAGFPACTSAAGTPWTLRDLQVID